MTLGLRAMFSSDLFIGIGSCILACSSCPSAVGSGVLSMQRGGGWPGSRSQAVMEMPHAEVPNPHTPANSSVQGGVGDALLESSVVLVQYSVMMWWL